MVKIEQREASKSSQELEAGLQLNDTAQVTKYQLDAKKVKGRMEEEEKKEKKNPKSRKSSWTRTRSIQKGWPWSWSWSF